MRQPGLLVAFLLSVLVTACTGPEEDPHLDAKIAAAFQRCEDATLATTDTRDASEAWIRAARERPGDFVPGSLLVGYAHEGPGEGRFGALTRRDARLAAAVRRDHGLDARASEVRRVDRVRTADPVSTSRRLLADPRVRYAHPEPKLRTFGVDAPSDPHFPQQWSLPAFGVDRAWEIQPGADGVRIAVVDVGFDTAHEDLHARFDSGWDFVGGDADVATGDVHGTHVAGIAGATTDNGTGVAGVTARGVRLIPLKIAEDVAPNGVARELTPSAVAAAVLWASGIDPDGPDVGPPPPDPPVDVISISLGTSPPSDQVLPVIDDAVLEAWRRGILVFAAAGNAGRDTAISAPANGPCAIAVGSVDEDREVSGFSNYDDDARRIDLVAPGGRGSSGMGVWSTLPGDRYGPMTGTSMATPFVAGSAALLASQYPAWSHEEILDQLFRTAERPEERVDPTYGFGIVCADAALGAPTRCGR